MNVTASIVNVDPAFSLAEIAPPHPSTHSHDTNDTPVRLNEGTVSPISNTPPSPLSRSILLIVDAPKERESVLDREKRGDEVRVNVWISVLSTLISPPVMLNGDDECGYDDVEEMVMSIIHTLPPLSLISPADDV